MCPNFRRSNHTHDMAIQILIRSWSLKIVEVGVQSHPHLGRIATKAGPMSGPITLSQCDVGNAADIAASRLFAYAASHGEGRFKYRSVKNRMALGPMSPVCRQSSTPLLFRAGRITASSAVPPGEDVWSSYDRDACALSENSSSKGGGTQFSAILYDARSVFGSLVV